MTSEEIRTEYQYRIDERLGILCPLREPTTAQMEIAQSEADDWLASYTNEDKENRKAAALRCEQQSLL